MLEAAVAPEVNRRCLEWLEGYSGPDAPTIGRSGEPSEILLEEWFVDGSSHSLGNLFDGLIGLLFSLHFFSCCCNSSRHYFICLDRLLDLFNRLGHCIDVAFTCQTMTDIMSKLTDGAEET